LEIGVTKIYVAVDGPRGVEDEGKVQSVRALVSTYSKDVVVATRFGGSNLGCRTWVSSSINWFFNAEAFGIIVEEDILLDARFYEWCLDVGSRFENDAGIMHVNAFYPSGSSLPERNAHLTKFATSWGWATWRDAWSKYDDSMSGFLKRGLIGRLTYLKAKIGAGWPAAIHYFFALHMTAQGKLSSWAYRWNLTIWDQDGVALSPGINLSENIGVGQDASHTGNEESLLAFKISEDAKISSDSILALDRLVDRLIFRSVGKTHSFSRSLRMFVSVLVPNGVFFAIRRRFRR
jgi:hypothetical protein